MWYSLDSDLLRSQEAMDRRKDPCTLTICDFDETLYKFMTNDKMCTLLVSVPGFEQVSKFNLDLVLSRVYSDMVGPGAQQDGVKYDVSLNFDLSADQAEPGHSSFSLL